MHENIPEKCQDCKLCLEQGYSFRPNKNCKDGSTKYICFACSYDEDCWEQLTTGILRSSLATSSFIKKDWVIFKPYFELEVMMTVLFQQIWNKYKNHETLNDPNLKKAIIVDVDTKSIYSRTWGEDSKEILKNVAKNSLIIEIFDGMCGYIGIDLYSAHSEHGMWIQGQLRSKESPPWYRSCYCTMNYAKEISEKLEKFLDLSKTSVKLEQDRIKFQLDYYNLPKNL